MAEREQIRRPAQRPDEVEVEEAGTQQDGEELKAELDDLSLIHI